jgi:hypothetical protein
LTCAEIVARVPNLDTRLFLADGTFCVNGEVVPRDMWHRVRPKANRDLCVTLHMPIRGGGGGGGGGKDVIRVVAAIALVVVATAITGGAAAGLFGAGTFAAGSIGAQILAGAITVGGALLLGAFVKPPSAAVEDTKGAQEETGTAALQGNVLRRGESVPRVVGTHRVFPPLLAQPLVDLDDDYNEIIEGVYGLAGPHRIREIKFGDVLADEIDLEQLRYEFFELSPDDGGIDDNVQLMLHLDGEQDSVAFEDTSFFERGVSATGGVFLDKRFDWLGLTAAYFPGSGSYLSTPSVPGFALEDEEFSIDFWFEWDSSLAIEGALCGQTDSGLTAAGSSFYIVKNAAGFLEFNLSNGTTFTTLTNTSTINQARHHCVVARVGNTLGLWIDGVMQAAAAFSGTVPGVGSSLDIGSRGGGFDLTNTWNGWIDELRFITGASAYTPGVNFTPRTRIYQSVEPTLITRYGKTGQPNIILSKHRIQNDQPTQATRDKLANQTVPQRSLPQAQSVVARGSGFDEVWVTLTLPGGLFYSDTDFEDDWFYSIPFRVRVRELGTDEWYNLPELHVHDRRTAQFSRMLVFRWDSETVLPNGVPNVVPSPRKGWRAAYSTVPVQTLTPAGLGGWTANTHFYAGTGDTYLTEENFSSTGLRNINMRTERVEFFLDGLVAKGPIEVEVRRGQPYTADKFTYSTYNLNTDPPADALANGVVDFFGYVTLSSDQVIILKQSNASDQVQVSRISTVWNSSPIARKGEFAAIYTQVTARSLDALSCLASGLVPDWDGAQWTGLNTTANPAPHYRDVLVGRLNDNRIPSTLVNDEVLLEWRQRCIDLDFQCNAVFSGVNVDRVLEVIASCGYARPRRSEVWDVAQDRDFTNIPPVQVFTPRNMRGFKFEKAFIRHRPDGLRVRFSDAFDSFVERTIVVPRLGVLVAETGRLEEIRYDGLTTTNEVVLKALYDQQQIIDRFTFYHGEVDVEVLVCRRGDLVVVQHDTLDRFAGFSRILEVEIDGGTVTSITLDGSVSPIDSFFANSPPFFTEPSNFFSNAVGVGVRQKDGSLRVFQADLSDDGFTLTPNPELTNIDPEIFEVECLVTTGRLLRESRRMLVFEIRPRTNLTADVTLVDEAPQLWQFPEPLQVEEAFMRNKVVNGDMRLDQRGGGAVHTLTDGVQQYTLDRWWAYNVDSVGSVAAFTVQQLVVDPPSGFTHYLRAAVVDQVNPLPAADEYVLGYTFTEDDIRDLDWARSTGRSVTLSFMVRSSITGTFSGALGSPLEDQSYPFTFSIPVANTWARRILTIPAPAIASPAMFAAEGRGLVLRFSLGCGSNNLASDANQWVAGSFRGVTGEAALVGTLGATLDVTGVQFEIAPATQFEQLPIFLQQELAYRFCQAFDASGIMAVGQGLAVTPETARINVFLPVPLRAVPPVSLTTSGLELSASGPVTVPVMTATLVSPDESSPGNVHIEVIVASGLTAGESLTLRINNGTLLIDAELYGW